MKKTSRNTILITSLIGVFVLVGVILFYSNKNNLTDTGTDDGYTQFSASLQSKRVVAYQAKEFVGVPLQENGFFDFPAKAGESTLTDGESDQSTRGLLDVSLVGKRSFIQDNGTTSIFYDSPISLDKIVQSAQDIFNQDGSSQADIRTYSITTSGGSQTVLGGAPLARYAQCVRCTITTDGNDLIISAQQHTLGRSFLVIDETMPMSVRIAQPISSYDDTKVLIQRNTFSLIEFSWRSEAETVGVVYNDGNKEHILVSINGGYDEGFLSIVPGVIDIPPRTTLQLAAENKSAQAEIFLLEIRAGTTQGISPFREQFSEQTIAALEAYLGTDKNIRSVPVSDSGVIDGQSITFSDNAEQLVVIQEDAFSYIFPFSIAPFSATIDYTVEGSWGDQNPYIHAIQANHKVNTDELVDELSQIFNGVDLLYDTTFSTQPVPLQEYSGSLKVISLFGESYSLPVKYSTRSMDPMAVRQSIVSNNTISILPTDGSFKDILIQYRNIESFPVSIQSCSLSTSPDMSTFQGTGIENYLFNCDEQLDHTEFVSPQGEAFEYWRTYRTLFPIPEFMEESQAFRVSFTDLQGTLHSHFMVKSDIGIWTKVDNSGVHIRSFTLNEGSPVEQGTAKVTRFDGSVVDNALLENGYAFVALPEVDITTSREDRWRESIFRVDVSNENGDWGFVVLDRSGSDSIYIPVGGNDDRYIDLSAKISPSELHIENQQRIDERSRLSPVKIYGYTDRALYKTGEEVYFTGFIRDLLAGQDDELYEEARITVTIDSPMFDTVYAQSGLQVDQFGGFSGSYTIPEGVALGEYMITYTLENIDAVSYTHMIRIEEYQKPTFFATLNPVVDGSTIALQVTPEYYFGAPLTEYDVTVNWSIATSEFCWYCWWNDDSVGYKNFSIDTFPSEGGQEVRYGVNQPQIEIPLFDDPSGNVVRSTTRTLKAEVTIKDNRTQEVQLLTLYEDIAPGVEITLAGNPYEWVFNENGTPSSANPITITIPENAPVQPSSLRYELYYRGFEQSFSVGVDANSYYVYDQEYALIDDGSLSLSRTFRDEGVTINYDFLDKPGSYFLRIIAEGSRGEILGENQKIISYYSFGDDGADFLGTVPNNYTLNLSTSKNIYAYGELIILDIEPYQQGAWVVVTVEKGQFLLDKYLVQLDGSPLTIPVKEQYAPNVVVSVMQLQGSDQTPDERKEPRFYAGYTTVSIDNALHTLTIDVTSDKTYYAPGDEVVLTFEIRDYQDNLIDTRLSVSVVDQALASLYHQIKYPLPHFFSSLGSSVATYTNLKLLYQSLKVFATGGSKGGDGLGFAGTIGYVRNDLKDSAFWDSAVYTEEGTAQVRFTLPENLTTWLIDVVGYTASTQFGTQTETIVVTSPLVVEANPPLFVTVGDSIEVPVRTTITAEGEKDGTIDGYAYIKNARGEQLQLGSFSLDIDQGVLVELYMPPERSDSPYITFGVTGSYGEYEDGIEYTIPVRTDGLQIRESYGAFSQSGSVAFEAPKARDQVFSLSVSSIPVQFVSPALNYLLTYQYGNAENLMSRLLTVHYAKNIAQQGLFSTDMIQGNSLVTDGGLVDIQTFTDSSIQKILGMQTAYGYFTYRPNSLITNDEYSSYYYTLTAYIYGGLLELAQHASNEQGVRIALERARQYLRDHRAQDQESFLYALYQKTRALGSLQQIEYDHILTIEEDTTQISALFAYLIASYSNNEELTNRWRQYASPIPSQALQGENFSEFITYTTTLSWLIEAYSQDSSINDEQLFGLLTDIVTLRDDAGLWGVSSQDNLAALRAITILAEETELFDTSPASCQFSLNDDRVEIAITQAGSTNSMKIYGDGGSINTERTCDRPLFVDLIMHYIPENLADIENRAQDVSDMDRQLSESNPLLGSVVEVIGTFTTEKVGSHVVVDLFVPAQLKLLSSIRSYDNTAGTRSFPFELSDSSCYPDHREVRFDRLMLYYERLEPTSCSVSIEALYSYNGTTTTMPFRLFEMYKGLLNGRVRITDFNE